MHKIGSRCARLLSYPTRQLHAIVDIYTLPPTLPHSFLFSATNNRRFTATLAAMATIAAENPVTFNFTPELLAQAKAKAVAVRDDHPEGATIRRQVSLQLSLQLDAVY